MLLTGIGGIFRSIYIMVYIFVSTGDVFMEEKCKSYVASRTLNYSSDNNVKLSLVSSNQKINLTEI